MIISVLFRMPRGYEGVNKGGNDELERKAIDLQEIFHL